MATYAVAIYYCFKKKGCLITTCANEPIILLNKKMEV